MSLFKRKPPKLKYRTDAITLDEIHKNHMNKLDTNYKKLEYLSKTSELIVGYYEKISKEHYNNYESDNEKNIVDINDININGRIDENFADEYNNDIDSSNNELISFIPSTDLKFLNEISKDTRKAKKPIKKRKKINSETTQQSIFNFFSEEIKKEENEDKENKEDKKNKENKEQNNEKDNIKNPEFFDDFLSNFGKIELQEKFLLIMDKNYACTKVKAQKNTICQKCNIEKTLFAMEGCYKCTNRECVNCGETEYIVMESENNGNKELNFEKQKYPYKKTNHMKEKLNQFQSKENADIPNEVYLSIQEELRKKRINIEDVTPSDIKEILKKNRYTNHYEHLQQIYCKITGTPPIALSRELETKIISMFQSIQESFQKYKSDERSNFLSYSYVLNKLFRILGYEKHSDFFYLLKSKEKLRDQDNTWAKICKDMGWKFHPSF